MPLLERLRKLYFSLLLSFKIHEWTSQYEGRLLNTPMFVLYRNPETSTSASSKGKSFLHGLGSLSETFFIQRKVDLI